jgi:hypothetical protein
MRFDIDNRSSQSEKKNSEQIERLEPTAVLFKKLTELGKHLALGGVAPLYEVGEGGAAEAALIIAQNVEDVAILAL